MTESTRRSDPKRRIIGFSLNPQLAVKVKAEAARRDMPLNKLFEELWETYEKTPKKAKT